MKLLTPTLRLVRAAWYPEELVKKSHEDKWQLLSGRLLLVKFLEDHLVPSVLKKFKVGSARVIQLGGDF